MEAPVLGLVPGGMVFVRVNQVLVRLWARCARMSDRMLRRPASVANAFRGDCCVLSEKFFCDGQMPS